MPAPHPAWPTTSHGPVVEIGYPYVMGDAYRYDVARYDTTGRYGPWFDWHRVECDVRSASIVRGSAMPGQRPSSATANVSLTPRGATYAPWWRDDAGNRPNRANLPLRVSVDDGTTTWPLFTGWIDTWVDTDDLIDPVVTLVASDGFKHLALLNQEALPVTGAGEAAGTRIGRILDRGGWQAERDLSTGTIPLQGTTLAAPALDEIFLTTDTEGGVSWIDRDGRFRFVDREWLRQKGATVDWRIGDRNVDELAVAATAIVSTADEMDIDNVVGISKPGGTALWVQDDASIAKYGRHSWSRFDLPFLNDGDATVIAGFQLADRVARDYHLQAVALNPIVAAECWPVVLGVDLYDSVYVSRERDGYVLEEFASVIGIDHQLDPAGIVTVLSLGPRIRQTNARYDVDLYDVATYSGT